MSHSPPISRGAPAPARRWRVLHPGTVVALALGALFGGALLSLLSNAGGLHIGDLVGPYLLRVVWSSLAQAALSTVLSLMVGGAVALAVARLTGAASARLMRALLLTAAVAPTIVVVLGVVTVYGRAGLAASMLESIGVGGWPSIYGIAGILVAHVALNAPYAARVFLNGLSQVPSEHHRIAAMCGFGPWQVFRQCDWPALRREIPGLAALIALLCFTSFAVVLTLGGGPRWATLEVAIYEALRIDVDFGRAALLSILQIIVAGAFILLADRAIDRHPAGDTSGRMIERADAGDRRIRALDGMALALYLLLLAPIMLVPLSGLWAMASIADDDVWRAALTSLLIALMAAVVCVVMAVCLAARTARAEENRERWRGALHLAPLLALAAPPFALVAGLYGPLRRFGDNATVAVMLVPTINAIMALPFAYRMIEPAVRLARLRYGRLSAHLDISGLDRWRIVEWPLMRRPIIAAFALALALSLGDFGVAALFSGQDFRTLPLLLHERMGAYRMAEAQAIALLMLALAFALALTTERFADAADR